MWVTHCHGKILIGTRFYKKTLQNRQQTVDSIQPKVMRSVLSSAQLLSHPLWWPRCLQISCSAPFFDHVFPCYILLRSFVGASSGAGWCLRGGSYRCGAQHSAGGLWNSREMTAGWARTSMAATLKVAQSDELRHRHLWTCCEAQKHVVAVAYILHYFAMGLHVVAMCVVIPLLSVHSRPTWYIEESRKSFCNKGSGQKRLPDLPCQVNWRRDVNFFVQSLPYCIFFNNTNCMKQLLQTQGDVNEKDSARSKYGHASPRYKKIAISRLMEY